MATVNKDCSVEMELRCRAFSGEGVRANKILVEPGRNGAVLVWDSVAGHYTRCHALSEAIQKRIRSEALHRWHFEFRFGS